MKHNARALTIVELMMGLSITVLTGLTIAGVTTALTNAYSSTEQFHEHLQVARTAMNDIQKMVKKSKLVTAVSDDKTVFWAEDTNGDGQINHSEVSILRYKSSAGKLQEYRVQYPDDMSQSMRDALDVVEPLAGLTNAQSVFRRFKNDSYIVKTTLSTGVKTFSLAASPDPPFSKLVGIDLEIGSAGSSMTLRSACALRADAVGRVGISDDEYVLIPLDGDDDDDDDDDDD